MKMAYHHQRLSLTGSSNTPEGFSPLSQMMCIAPFATPSICAGDTFLHAIAGGAVL